jgi:hypothetical protein
VSAVLSTPVGRGWLAQLLSGAPHQVVGPLEDPYLKRWFLVPPNRWGKSRYQFVKSDDPDALHNHPWGFVSACLWGGYVEVTSAARTPRRAGSIAYRPASYRHRVELLRDSAGRGQPCWTIILTGSRRRPWGFWCPRPDGPDRFVPWQAFGAGGCGETTKIHP